MSQQPPDRRGYDRQVRLGQILGLLFLVAGFVVITLGWRGMAQVACPDCQLPYLLSGGAAGLGLLLLGTALLVISQVRSERLKLGIQLENLGSALTKASVGAATPAAAGAANGLVGAGKSTYHRPDCRLVEGKSSLEAVPIEAARTNGLTPCRVCKPDEPGGAGTPQRRTSRKASSRRRS